MQNELFAVVADVKDYPLLVPWCSGARIHRDDPHEIIADLVIGFGPFQESFTTQVTLDRPRQVLVRAIEGPLEHLTNTWTFTPVGDQTHVDFIIDFQFKSHLLDHVANGMFHEATTRMMSAFASHVLPEPGAFGGLARMKNAAMTTRGTATKLPPAKMVENDSPIRSRNGPMPNAATP
jgi:coenzyme Q-binding protein COQ10